jgi:3-hydroxyisobutyrate dehydrogenase
MPSPCIRCRRAPSPNKGGRPRNCGLKAIVPGVFPERAFSTGYALKDLSYALELAGDAGIRLRGAELIGTILQQAIDAGEGDAYFPVIAKLIEKS